MVILLTGSTGFLGLPLMRLLVEKGHDVIVSCRNINKLTALAADLIDKIHVWDLNQVSEDVLFKEFTIDVVVHAATDYGRDKTVPCEVFWSNEAFPIKLLQQIILNKHCTFINIDTFFNMKQSGYQYLESYTLSKRHFQEWGEYCAISNNLKFVNLRLFHVFGLNDHPSKFVPAMLSKCLNTESIDLTSGEQKRDFIYLDDVLNAVCTVIRSKLNAGYHHFDVGRGESVTLRHFVERMNALCGKNAILNFGALPQRAGELMNACADIKPLMSLGWLPKISLSQGLALMIENQNT